MADKKSEEAFFDQLAQEYSAYTGDKMTGKELRDHFDAEISRTGNSLAEALYNTTSFENMTQAPETRGATSRARTDDWKDQVTFGRFMKDIVEYGVRTNQFKDATPQLLDATRNSIQRSLDNMWSMSSLPPGFEEATSTSNTKLGSVPVPQTSPRGRGAPIGNLPGNWGNSPNIGYQKLEPEVARTFVGNIATKGTKPNEGIDKMNTRAQQGLLDFVKASGRYAPTITATVGSHGKGNKTHSRGAAYDVRTRDLSTAAVRAQLEAAMYTRPESIRFNDSAFAPHMHVDYNGGYGRGVSARSRTSGLPEDLQAQLQAFNAYHQGKNPDWVPAVPTAIAPVPERAPRGPLGPSLSAIASRGVGRVSPEFSPPTMPSSSTLMAPGPTNEGALAMNSRMGAVRQLDNRYASAAIANAYGVPQAPSYMEAPTSIPAGQGSGIGFNNIGGRNAGSVNLERSLIGNRSIAPSPVERFAQSAAPLAPAGTPGNMGAAGYGLSLPSRAATPQPAQTRAVNLGSTTSAQMPYANPQKTNEQRIAESRAQMVRDAIARDKARAASQQTIAYGTPQANNLAAAYAGYAAARGAPIGNLPSPQKPAPQVQQAAPVAPIQQPRQVAPQISSEPKYSGRTPGDRARSASFQPGGIFGYTSQQARGGGYGAFDGYSFGGPDKR